MKNEKSQNQNTNTWISNRESVKRKSSRVSKNVLYESLTEEGRKKLDETYKKDLDKFFKEFEKKEFKGYVGFADTSHTGEVWAGETKENGMLVVVRYFKLLEDRRNPELRISYNRWNDWRHHKSRDIVVFGLEDEIFSPLERYINKNVTWHYHPESSAAEPVVENEESEDVIENVLEYILARLKIYTPPTEKIELKTLLED